MSAPAEPRVLAEVGGLAVAEQGPLIVVVDRGNGPATTVAFVFGVLGLVVGGFSAMTLALGVAGRPALPWWFGGIGLLAGIAFAGAALGVVGRIRRVKALPLSTFRPVAIFDRARGVFVDDDGVVVAPLNQVRFQRRMQLTSSSPTLVVETPGGARILKRGNPFNGGIGNLEAVLTAAVFGPPR